MTEKQIAIDGPAASGKSTVARKVAERTGGIYVNTGDMYRALTWRIRQENINPKDEPDRVRELLQKLDLQYSVNSDGEPELLLDGEKVSQNDIRDPAVAAEVSHVAGIAEVREWLMNRQRETRKFGLIVVEGRDIGTIVFPDADYKFFLTASAEERARRRLGQGGETFSWDTVESVAKDIAERDRLDSTREVAPLRPAEDAVLIDSSDLDVDEVVEKIVSIVNGTQA